MTFEEWLKTVWQEDENRAIRKRQIDGLREEVKQRIIEENYHTDSEAIMGFMQSKFRDGLPDWIVHRLISVALEYLLGENFNGASVGYYREFKHFDERQSLT